MIEILKSDAATILSWIINALIAVFAFIMKSMFVEKKDHNALSERVASVEKDVDGLPSVTKLHSLSLQIEELSGELHVVEERLEGFDRLSKRMQKQVDLMDEYLRRMGK